MKAKKALNFHFPSRSRGAFPARPDTLHGARWKYDPAKGIRQENPKGKPTKAAIARSNILAPGTLLGLDRYSYSRLVCCGRLAASALMPRKPARGFGPAATN
jgi:hypothetical protein